MLATLEAPARGVGSTNSTYVQHSESTKSAPLLLFVVGAATATSVLLGAPAVVPSAANATSIVVTAPASSSARTAESASAKVKRMRELSGLTWDQFARAFNVSRRAVHHWASGGNLSAVNAALLDEFDRLLGAVGTGQPENVRQALTNADGSGESLLNAFRKLAIGAYSEAKPRVASLEATLDPS